MRACAHFPTHFMAMNTSRRSRSASRACALALIWWTILQVASPLQDLPISTPYFQQPQHSIPNVFIDSLPTSSSSSSSSSSSTWTGLRRTREAAHHVYLHQNKCGGTTTKQIIRKKKVQSPPVAHGQASSIAACRAGRFEEDKFDKPWIIGGYSNGVCDILADDDMLGDADSCHYFTMFRNPLFRIISAFKFCNYANPNGRFKRDQLCDSYGKWTHNVSRTPGRAARFALFVNRWSDFSVAQLSHTLGECGGKCNSQHTTCWTRKLRSLGRADLRAEHLVIRGPQPRAIGSRVEVPLLRTAREIASGLDDRFSVIGLQEHYGMSLYLFSIATNDGDLRAAALTGGRRQGRPKVIKASPENQETITHVRQVCRQATLASFLRHDFLVYAHAVRIFVAQIQSPALIGQFNRDRTHLLNVSSKLLSFGVSDEDEDEDEDEGDGGTEAEAHNTKQTPTLIDPLLWGVNDLVNQLKSQQQEDSVIDEVVAQYIFNFTCTDLGHRR